MQGTAAQVGGEDGRKVNEEIVAAEISLTAMGATVRLIV